MYSVDSFIVTNDRKIIDSTSGVWNAVVFKKKKKGGGCYSFKHYFTGHFAKECFVQPGGTKYSLIPEEEEEEVAAAGYEGDKKTSMVDEPPKKRKKVWSTLLLAWKSEPDNLFCIVTPVIYYGNMVMSSQFWAEKVAEFCACSIAKQESSLQTF